MPFRYTFSFRNLVGALQINQENDLSLSGELTRELEDWRKFLLNLLVAFLSVHAFSPSNVFETMTLALVVYTINLHITINASFLRNRPALSKFLHAIPLFGILCMTVFGLVTVVQSPLIAAAVLLACVMPPLVIGLHLARQYIGVILPLPVQMQEVARGVPVPADTTTSPRH